MIQIDARGLSCPQPVMLALKAIGESTETVTVEVDHETAAENVERAALEKGRTCRITKTETGYSVEIA